MEAGTVAGADHHQFVIGAKKTRGKQKIEIKRIENKTRRQVTFSKRRDGLFKKCSELGSLHGATVAAIAFSEAGKPFSYGNPSAQAVLERYVDANNKNNIVERVNWWDDVDIDGLKLNELEAYKVSLEGLRKQVNSRIMEINNASIINGSDHHGFGFDNFDYSNLTDEDLGLVIGSSNLDNDFGMNLIPRNQGLISGCENFEYGNNVNGGNNLGGNQNCFDFSSIVNDPISLDNVQQASSSSYGNSWFSHNNYGMLPQITS